MLRMPIMIALLLLSAALAACVPYHPQPGQQSYVYNPVPGGGGH
jgi:hypothetical protein